MELLKSKTYVAPLVDETDDLLKELNLVYYGSEAAIEMGFEDVCEFHDSVKRAMELCFQAEIPLEGNFKRIYKCSIEGIEYDWKLSVLAYKLVCLNGSIYNPKVARLQIELLKNQSVNKNNS